MEHFHSACKELLSSHIQTPVNTGRLALTLSTAFCITATNIRHKPSVQNTGLWYLLLYYLMLSLVLRVRGGEWGESGV